MPDYFKLNLVGDLRLQLAEFNNFLIKNYLVGSVSGENNDELVSYLSEFLKKSNSFIGTTGQLIGDVDFIDQEDQNQICQLIIDASVMIYLLEESADRADLTKKINGIHMYRLSTTLDSISSYRKEFSNKKIDFDKEVKDFYADNSKYITPEGTFLHEVYHPTFEEAISYLNANAQVLKVKRTASRVIQAFTFFSIPLKEKLNKLHILNNKPLFFKHLLTSLTLVLLALAYIEPFFDVSDSISTSFEVFINDISTSQEEFTNQS